jgi:DNA-binding response OmpR family regulator
VDAAILDLWLGEADTGLDVLGWMRSTPPYRTLPVLILTGHKVTDDQEAVIRRHGAYVFYKPLRQDSFLEYLRRLVPLPATAAPAGTHSALPTAEASSPQEDEAALALHTAARDVQRIVRNYRGVLELRERQLENAAAGHVSHRREQQTRDTLQGLVADLDRYAADLRPSIENFNAAAERLRAHFAREGTRPPQPKAGPAHDAPEVAGHIDRLKLARSHRQAVVQAKEAVEPLSDRGEQTRIAVGRLRVLFDAYYAALDNVEAVSIDLLVAHGLDPRETQ